MPEKDPPNPQDHADLVAVGRNIRAARDSLRLAREVVAERAGINVDYLGEIERGEKWPGLSKIRAIGRALDVSPTRFFEFDDDQNLEPVEKLQRLLQNKSPEQKDDVLRVVKAMLRL